MIYNPECTEPKITIKKDSVLPEFDKPHTTNISSLPADLQARNTTTTVPLQLTYETSTLMNSTFIDTPGLAPSDDSTSDADFDAADAAIASLATASGDPRSTVVLCVERAGAWPSWLSACWSRQHRLSHPVGVFTSAYSKFSTFSGASGMAKYIIDKPAQNVNNFFVELPTSPDSAESPDALREAVLKYDAAFRARTACVDKRFESALGFERLHGFVYDACLRGYRQLCPHVRQRFRDLLTAVDKDLGDTAQRSAGLSPWALRSSAMGTFGCYAQLMQSLLDGTADSLSAGHVLTLGQTLEEETRAFNGGAWPTAECAASGRTLGDAQRPLLGRQQFERLLAEFRAVVADARMEDLTHDEIVASYGTHKSIGAETAKMGWVACDLVRLRLDAQVKPLVNQLKRRVEYLLLRLSDTAFAVAAFPKFRAAQGPNVSFEYPFFNTWMKGLYGRIVGDAVAAFGMGCDEEFYPTQTMVWEMAPEVMADLRLPKDTVAAVRMLAERIFEESKKRIARNILRSCFYRFLE